MNDQRVWRWEMSGEEGTQRTLAELVKEHPLLSVLSPGQLNEVAQAAEEKSFGRGQVILKQGAPSGVFYIMLAGLVEIRDGDRTLTRLGPGRFFGESALVNDSSYGATVIAVERTRCAAINGPELRSYPGVVVKILEEATHRNRAMVLQRSLGADPTKQLQPVDESAVGFKSAKTKLLFDSLVRSFTEDYMMKRLFFEQAGWRTIGELSAATKIPHATLYGQHGRYGAFMLELLSRGLVEARVFKGQRGRGGEVVRIRIAYDKEPVKRYVDRVVMRGKSQR